MGHPQPPTPIQINNLTAFGIVTNKIIAKGTRQWTCGFIGYTTTSNENNSVFTGSQEETSFADYWTSHHTATNYKHM